MSALHSINLKSGSSIDHWLMLSTFVLLGISLLMVYSTTAVFSGTEYTSSNAMLYRHAAHIFVGLLFFFLCSRINLGVLYKIAPVLFLLSIILLILTLIPGIGHVAGGARRWIVLGPLRVQPGELAKFTSVIFFATYIHRHSERMGTFRSGIFVPFLLLSFLAFLLLLEPDFGSTVVILMVVFCELLIVTKLSHLVAVAAVACLGVMSLVVTSPYRFRRFVTFLDPFHDPSSAGYQLIQSLIAVGSGGLTGVGFGTGKQKLFYLPAAHTDFIFAVIAEELGIIGALMVLALFLLILYRGLIITRGLANDPYLSSLAMGCTCLIVLPALLNIAVVLGLLPTKGMVLPLVAYGGTAMIVHLSAMGLLLRLSKYTVS